MILGNYAQQNRNAVREWGQGFTNPFSQFKPTLFNSFYTPDTPLTGLDYSAFNHGYNTEYAWNLALKSGGIATTTTLNGSGTISAGNLAAGVNIISTIAGLGEISSATGALVVSAVATILCSGDLSADIVGKLEAVATLAGAGDLTAAIDALASIVATIPGTGTLSNALISALGSMSGDILVNSAATITNESIAAEVWNTLASSYNDAGTMGEKLNSAGGGSSPTDIADAVRTELSVELARIDATVSSRSTAVTMALVEKILRNKSVTDPVTGVMTIYDDDGVTPLIQADVFENAAGTQPYRGQGADRRDRLE